jgi:hypothetical protein
MRLLFIVGLLYSSLSFSQTEDKSMLWPRLTVWPSGVDLQIQNFTQFDYSCSGTIYMTHQSRRISTEYYFGRVYSRGFELRRFYNRYINDRIISAHHNIYCYRL